MSIGYDVYEDNRSFEHEGLTGTVKRYVTESMKFPCIIIEYSEDKPIEKYKLEALKQMFKLTQAFDEDAIEGVTIYYSQDSKTVRLGQVTPRQVKAFLNLFENNNLVGYYDKDTILVDEKIYVLA